MAFFDAGQVKDFGEPFSWMEPLLEVRAPNPPSITDPFATSSLIDPSAPGVETIEVGGLTPSRRRPA